MPGSARSSHVLSTPAPVPSPPLATVDDLPDGVLRKILAQLEPDHFVRAGATCATWRRLTEEPAARRAILQLLGHGTPASASPAAVEAAWRRVAAAHRQRRAGRFLLQAGTTCVDGAYWPDAVAVGPRGHVAVLSATFGLAPRRLYILDPHHDRRPRLAVNVPAPLLAAGNPMAKELWGMAWCGQGNTLVLGARSCASRGHTRAWTRRGDAYTETEIADLPGNVLTLSDDGGLVAAVRSSMTGSRREGVVCHPVRVLDRASGASRAVGGLFNPAQLAFSPDRCWLLGIGFGVPRDGHFASVDLRLERRPLVRLMPTAAGAAAGAGTTLLVGTIDFAQRPVAGSFAADSRSVWLAGAGGRLVNVGLDGQPLRHFDTQLSLIGAAFALGGHAAALLHEDAELTPEGERALLWPDAPPVWATVSLWDIGQPEQLKTLALTCGRAEAHGVAFARDGARVSLAVLHERFAEVQTAHFAYP